MTLVPTMRPSGFQDFQNSLGKLPFRSSQGRSHPTWL